jgi:heterodisulfide reductase subunit B
MGRGQSTAEFQACWPEYDPEHWFDVDGYDAEAAAEKAAETICSKDCECYSSFEEAQVILVRDKAGSVRAFKVRVEMLPDFTAVAS